MALQEVVALRWRKITGSDVIEGYGLSEASPVLTCNPVRRAKPGSIGVPLPSTEMKCVDDQGNEVAIGEAGEIIARGPQIMPGYWRQPGETGNVLRDGWLFTGDIGKMDAEGYFTIVDRRKDMILVSGFNVYPNEVEAVLAGLAGVKDCAVIGVPDAASGEAVKAAIRRLTPRRCAISADANSPATKCRDWSSSATICRSRTSARSCARICAKTRPRTPVKGRSEQLGDTTRFAWRLDLVFCISRQDATVEPRTLLYSGGGGQALSG